MKTVQMISLVQDFLDNKGYIKMSMLVERNGKVSLVLRDNKRGQTLTALVNNVVKPDIAAEPIF